MNTLLPSIPNFIFELLSNNGKPAAGAKIYTYESGTNVLKATYQDAYGTAANTNPIILNAYGRAQIFGSGAYGIEVFDADNSTILNRINGIVFSDASTGGNGNITVLANYNAARVLTSSPSQVYIQGRSTAGDGGQGLFALVSDGNDDDGYILSTNSGSAYYKRVGVEYLDPVWYGAVADEASDQFIPLQSVIAASVSLGLPIFWNESFTIGQNLTISNGATVEFGSNGVIVGSASVDFKFAIGSRFIGSVGCIGANVNLTLGVGTCDYVNPNIFVGADTYKLSAANYSIAANSLEITAVSGSGWGIGSDRYNIIHTPNDSTYGDLYLKNMITAKDYVASFKLERPSTVEFVASNNITSTGWTGSWTTGYAHNTGNTTSLVITTKAKADTVNPFLFTVVLEAVSKGYVQIVLGSTILGTYSSNGTITSNITFNTDNPNLTFVPSSDFDGTLINMSLTKSAAILNDQTNWMNTTFTGWTGTKAEFTNTSGNTTPAVFTLPTALPVGTKLAGSFTLSHTVTSSTELITGSNWTITSNSNPATNGWTGTPNNEIYANRWYYTNQPSEQGGGNNNSRTSLGSGIAAPGGKWTLAYRGTYAGDGYYAKVNTTLALGSVLSTYRLTITVANVTEGAVRVEVGSWSKEYDTNGVYSVDLGLQNATTIALMPQAKSYPIQKAFNGSVKLSLKAVNSGSLIVTADGSSTPIIMNDDTTKIVQKDGLYTFEVITSATTSNTLSFTPTSDFIGTVNNLKYIVTSPGSCEVYGSTYHIGTITEDGEYKYRFAGSSSNNFIELRPTTQFYGNLINIKVSEDYSSMPVKLTNTYNIDSDITLPWVDPFEGLIAVNGKINITIDGLYNNRAAKWLNFNTISDIGLINISNSTIYPEHVGALGNGIFDDSIGISYVIAAGKGELNNTYLIASNITSTNDMTFAGEGTLKIKNGVTLGMGNINIGNLNVYIDGSLSVSELAIDNVLLSATVYGSITSTVLTVTNSTLYLWNGISNSSVANIKDSTVTSICTLDTLITPFNNTMLIQNCTINDCKAITVSDASVIKLTKFNSPTSVALHVPANCTLTVDTCELKTALGISSETGSTTYVRGIRTTDRVMSTSNIGSYADDTKILHDGNGSIITEEPDNNVNPLLPRTVKNGAAYQTWAYTNWNDKNLITDRTWYYDIPFYTYAGSDGQVAQGLGPDNESTHTMAVGSEYWTSGTLNTPNDNTERTIYCGHDSMSPIVPEGAQTPNASDYINWLIVRWHFGHQFTLTLTPPTSGFSKNAGFKIFESFREYVVRVLEQHDYNELVNFLNSDTLELFERVIDLPVGGTSPINVKLPFAVGMALGMACIYQRAVFPNGGTSPKWTYPPGQFVAYNAGRAGIQTGITTKNMNGCKIGLVDSLVLPDQFNVGNYAKPRNKYTELQLNTTSTFSGTTNINGWTALGAYDSTNFGNVSIGKWSIINSYLEDFSLLTTSGSGSYRPWAPWIYNGAYGTIQETDYSCMAKYNINASTGYINSVSSSRGFAWINMKSTYYGTTLYANTIFTLT